MATFYIQLENRLLQISGELTAENISKALGYVPVSPNVTNELSQRVDNITFDSLKDNPFLQDGSGELNIVDESGNIIAKIDAEGIHSVDFVTGEHRLTEKADKADVPTKLSELKNDKDYITKSEVPDPDFSSLQGNPFAEDDSGNFTVVDENGNIGMQLNQGVLVVKDVVAGNDVLSNKVDKIEGKGLSTEDFTTALKERLLSLSNFDSTEIEVSIGKLQQQIDTLVNGNASEAIDTFNEIIAFLEGVEDTESLSGIIASIERQIANIRVPVKTSELTNDSGFITIDDVPVSEDETGELNIVDESGNIGMKTSSEAVYAKEFIAGGHKLSDKADKKYVDDAIKNNGGNIDLSDYETKSGSQAKLQEAKDYTDSQISELKEGLAVQTFDFSEAGTHWISFYIETSLEELCNALGSNGTKISTSTDNTGSENLILEYNAETGSWSGNLTEIDPLRMYMVTVSAPCTISLNGKKLDTEKSAITLNPGWNWIGYPSDKEISLSEAFVNLNIKINDQLKSHVGVTTYYGSSMGWYGSVETLIPGWGYMYKNNSKETKTLVFSTGEPNYIYETKIDAQVKLEESKEYTDSRISEIKERVVSQTIELNAGWNWVSFYIDIELVDLQNALGSNGSQIKDYAGNTTIYISGYGQWSPGGLSTISPNRMYMIQVKESCSITLEGKKLDPDKIDMLISSNTTSWISYPLSVAAELDKALVNVPVVAGDVIKSRDGESEYIEGHGWEGDLTIMEPGKGYQYISNSAESYNFKYPSLELDVEAELAKKQNQLVSGETIKTLNGESILGSGNIVIPQIVYIPNESSMPNPPVEGVLYLIGDEELKQIIQLKAGWNYVSFYMDEIEGADGLIKLQEKLGSNGLIIKDYSSYIEYSASYGSWFGSMESVSMSSPLSIKVAQDQTIEIGGNLVIPENYSLTIYKSANWIPYLYSTTKTISDILVNFTPVVGDYVKTFEDVVLCTYTDSGWDNNITLIPGEAYIYYSNSLEPKMLTFPKL